MSKTWWVIIFMMVAVSGAGSVHAAVSPWYGSAPVQVQLISGIKTIGQADTFSALVDIQLEDGWHTYWKAPGEAGKPAVFTWDTQDTNVKEAAVSWPVPARFDESGFVTFGYKSHVSFPVTITLSEPTKKTTLALKLDIMVCKDICIPQAVNAVLALDAGAGEKSAHAPRIEKVRAALPSAQNKPGLKIRNMVVSDKALVVGAFAQKGLANTRIIAVTAGGRVLSKVPQLGLDKEDPRQGLIVIDKPDDIEDLSAYLAGKTLEVLFTDGTQAVHQFMSLPSGPHAAK